MTDRLKAISDQISGSGNYPKGLLAGEVAIVTGAGQGIGRSTALLFAKEGAKVVVSDLDVAKTESVTKEIIAAGGDAIGISGDVTAADYPKKVVQGTISKYGKINHIINNAGFTFDKMLHTMPDDTFRLMLEVHNVAPFRLVREAAPYMRFKEPEKRENRCIINISSTSGLHGNTGQANYAVAKAGVVGFTKTIAKEWGPFGIRSNTVAFGYIETRLTAAKEAGATIEVNGQKIALGIPGLKQGAGAPGPKSIPDIPLGRPGSADEAAGGVLILCSPLASYITGHTLEVTGGRGI
ncbi:hypothetical protein DL96DRAFT_1708545 [Flagelloscypha sp. PMI_526]|nr:hypothetical protein DL96DRAFT_1708545 [Flagelloscypha sp. PMI_526]